MTPAWPVMWLETVIRACAAGLASFEHNGGTRILRCGYSFTNGIDPQAGTLLGT